MKPAMAQITESQRYFQQLKALSFAVPHRKNKRAIGEKWFEVAKKFLAAKSTIG